MAKENEISKKEYMEDSKGNLVPIGNISPIDIERDKFVKKIIVLAEKLSHNVVSFKQTAMTDMGKFMLTSARKYKTKVGGGKGNITLYSFDGRLKVTHTISDRITFNEGLQVAKSLIDSCINDWVKTANENIRIIINDAFYVDKQGKLNKEKILGLRKLKINDPRWKSAMKAIGESIQVIDSKPYIRCYKRDPSGQYHQIPLDVSAI